MTWKEPFHFAGAFEVVHPRGRGYLPDEPDERDFDASARFGAPRGLPASATALLEHAGDAVNQVHTSSCVGQAIKKAIRARQSFKGRGIVDPSALAIYAGGQAALEKFEDAGCYPRDAMKWIREMGVALEKDWPFDPAKATVKPPWHVMQEATRLVVFEWWRIFAEGPSRSDAVAKALADGVPVVFGAQIDQAFDEYSGGVIAGWDPESELDGHMSCLLGYETGDDGKRAFVGINSWGTGWGETGLYRIHEDALASPRCTDFYAVYL